VRVLGIWGKNERGRVDGKLRMICFFMVNLIFGEFFIKILIGK
jgi:hypothetical protein